ncbi:hypothetical protein SOVF_007190 [Spinacia oleracea]|nr:hypothetical protein SOVF_007190 [Spinacia oleracea]
MTVNPKIVHHSRSKSSPIKPPPFPLQFNEHLYRLQSSEGASTSQPLISYKLNGLIQLYSNMCQLACIQQDVPKEHHEKVVDFLLDGSLWLIDVCGTIRDFLMQTSEGTQRILSVLRRKLDQHEVAKEVSSYFSSRKMVRKGIVKSLRAAQSFGKKFNTDSSNENHETISFLRILEKSQTISVYVLKSLFSYVSGSRKPSETSKWSLFSKLIHSRQEQTDEEDHSKRNKFEVVDCALHMLTRQKTITWWKITWELSLMCMFKPCSNEIQNVKKITLFLTNSRTSILVLRPSPDD